MGPAPTLDGNGNATNDDLVVVRDWARGEQPPTVAVEAAGQKSATSTDEPTDQPQATQEGARWTSLFRVFDLDLRVRVDPLLDPFREGCIWIPYGDPEF